MFGSLGYIPIGYPLNSTEAADLTSFDAETSVARTAIAGYGAIHPNQFTLFQLAGHEAASPILDLHNVRPNLKGTEENPDVVGFPGIALDAVQLLDTMLGQFERARARPIFQSRPLTVALTERAAFDFSGGLSSVSVAVMNDGIFLMLRHRDAPLLKAHPPVYLGGYGRLVPKASADMAPPKLSEEDPYNDLSYAVLRVRTRAARLDPGI